MPPQTTTLDFDDWSTRLLTSGAEDGAGDPLVLLHSLGADASLWVPVMRELPASMRAVAIDTRGQGCSRSPAQPFTIDALAADVRAVLDRAHIARCTLVGISFGGMIAQAVAASAPSLVTRLVLMDTACEIPDAAREAWRERADLVTAEGMESVVAPTLDRWFPPGVVRPEPALLEGLETVVRGLRPEHYAAAARALADVDLRGRVARLTQPTLVAVGEHDIALPPACSQLLATVLPDARLHEFPGLGHCPPLEAPATVARLLEDFAGATS